MSQPLSLRLSHSLVEIEENSWTETQLQLSAVFLSVYMWKKEVSQKIKVIQKCSNLKVYANFF